MGSLVTRLAAIGCPAEALAAAQGIEFEIYRAESLIGLIPSLPGSLLPAALATARSTGDQFQRAQVLCALVPRLQERIDAEFSVSSWRWPRAACRIGGRELILSAMARYVEDDLLPEWLAEARQVGDGRNLRESCRQSRHFYRRQPTPRCCAPPSRSPGRCRQENRHPVVTCEPRC